MLTTSDITFEQMEAHFGDIAAYAYLEEIERAAGLAPKVMTGIEPQLRLTIAVRLQDTNIHSVNKVHLGANNILEAA